MGKKIFTILLRKFVFILTYEQSYPVMPQSILFFSTIGTLQQHLGEALSAVVSSSPELVAVLHIGEAYLQTIENSILRDQTGEFISKGFFNQFRGIKV